MKTILLAAMLAAFVQAASFPAYAEGPAWEERQATPLRGEYSFQDPDLSAFLIDTPRAALYLWSPHMPLSARGMADFLAAAKVLGVPAVPLLDPQADQTYAQKVASAENLPEGSLRRLRALSLIRHGALLHYPSVLVFDGGKLLGEPIAGGRRSAWASILRRRLAGEGLETRPSPLPAATAVTVKVRKITPLPGSDFGYFVKPVWGTRWVGLHKDWSSSYLFHLDDGRLVDTGTVNDTYVTPNDHRYVVYWGDDQGTLGLAETNEFLRRAEDPSYSPAAMLKDSEFSVYYQSIGVLMAGVQRSQYRVVTGSSDGPLLLRDYTITHRVGDSAAAVTGKSKVTPACRNFSSQGFGLPMLSKDGRFLSVNTDFAGRFGLVYELSPRDPGTCTVRASIDTPISKAAFSFDGKLLAFAAGAGGVFVYELATKGLRKLEGLEALLGAGTPLYPEFREDGSLVLPWLKDGGGISIVELEP